MPAVDGVQTPLVGDVAAARPSGGRRENYQGGLTLYVLVVAVVAATGAA